MTDLAEPTADAAIEAEAAVIEWPAPEPAREPITPPNFESTPTEDSLISAIADRYLALVGCTEEDASWPLAGCRLALRMDLTACHLNGTPLRLQDLHDASDFALAHDLQGIERHIDRTTGKLTDPYRASRDGLFVPRFAAPETQQEQV
jgi:hypothetical protein